MSESDAQYGMSATVFSATQGAYRLTPMLKQFRTMYDTDAIRLTNLFLNLIWRAARNYGGGN